MTAVAPHAASRTASDTTASARKTVLDTLKDPTKVAPRDARELSRHFFVRLAALEEGTPDHQYVRNTLIEMNLTLVRYAAARFRSRGADEMEDIVQVGTIGLIKAIDRFELSREVEFATFAVPYIVGEIKRFFRDTSWAVHVPRRLQEARVELARATDELSRRTGRAPTVRELAELMSLSETEIIEARKAANAYRSSSLDASLTGDDRDSVLADFIGQEEQALELIEDLHSLAPLVARLSDRDRQILHLRFVDEPTQAQIGARLGISQMHVSRLVNRIVATLRTGLLGESA